MTRSPAKYTPFVRGSLGLHAGAAALLLTHPDMWPWGLGAVAINQAVLTGAGLWPTSDLLGANITCLPNTGRPEVALTFDDGPDPDITPHVLDILDQHGARASFFCIGARARDYPDIVREIARRGHAVENHTDRHLNRFAALHLGGIRREIVAAQRTLTELVGRPPEFFRAPMGLRSPLLQPVLSSVGLCLTSWTRRAMDGVVTDPVAAHNRLQKGLKAGDVLLLHDRKQSVGRDGPAVALTVLPRLLESMTMLGLRSVTLREGRSH
jgi:peptidoglycan-N-acetylglucosamine deacetylase